MENNKKTEGTNNSSPDNLIGGNKSSNGHRWLIPVLATLIVVASILILTNLSPDESGSADTGNPLRAIGPESAPVTITEYADFGCITCKAWHQFGVRTQIIDHYGDQVRFVWRDFPVTTRQSPKAAEAGFCAHDQNQFWEYHSVLYENAPALAAENLKTYADSINLDTNEFNNCLDSGKYQQAVENELANARTLGLRGVPSFIVNGKRLVGPPSFEQLAATIDEILISQE